MIFNSLLRAKILITLILLFSSSVNAQILSDITGDEQITALAFGDSLTAGVGDGSSVGEFVEVAPSMSGSGGYPTRLSALLGIPVTNGGVPGEVFTGEGLIRLAAAVRSSSADIVVLLEGANDAIFQTSTSFYSQSMQRAINIIAASGKTPVVMTLPPPCCNNFALAPFTDSYSTVVKTLANENAVQTVDLKRVWETTCQNTEECELYNVPEGLHPNTSGYDVIAQAVAAALAEIDIFSEEGQQEFADAFEIDLEQVLVRPGGA